MLNHYFFLITIQLIFTHIILLYFAFLDFKNRKISNRYILCFFLYAILFNLIEMMFFFQLFFFYFIAKLIVFFLGFLLCLILFCVKIIAGGDGKVIIVIILLYPIVELEILTIFTYFFYLVILINIFYLLNLVVKKALKKNDILFYDHINNSFLKIIFFNTFYSLKILSNLNENNKNIYKIIDYSCIISKNHEKFQVLVQKKPALMFLIIFANILNITTILY
ncbi:MAG: hypothetical protein GF317_01400 [Candidatus Lokiarchaeota archaeon]|nr:hypothetical protein [Candidatus Lokiarchaeota archaeon]MBD3198600.1 hypothetical protein [Candidatus Lokiarchaeota archaeon]